jgi:lipoate-protein ligase B
MKYIHSYRRNIQFDQSELHSFLVCGFKDSYKIEVAALKVANEYNEVKKHLEKKLIEL